MRRVRQRVPRTEQERMFCEHWLRSHNPSAAAKSVGISSYNKVGRRWREKFADYLGRRTVSVEREVSKAIAYDQQDILNEMAAIGFANPLDYVVKTTEEKDGKVVEGYAFKPLEELTRFQAAAVSNVRIVGGKVQYRIPGTADKHRYLFDLGKNLGLFDDKLIQEFRHKHLHAHIDFSQLPQEQLQSLEQILIGAVGPEASRLLGLQPQPLEVEDATPIPGN